MIYADGVCMFVDLVPTIKLSPVYLYQDGKYTNDSNKSHGAYYGKMVCLYSSRVDSEYYYNLYHANQLHNTESNANVLTHLTNYRNCKHER